jgi:hypothetical protein
MLAMEKCDPNLAGLYQELADRFGSLSRLFGELSSPDAAKELLDSLTLADASKAFPRYAGRLDFPMLEKCFWLRELIEHVAVTPVGFVEECRVRDNLTPSEVAVYFSIAWRHRDRTLVGRQRTLHAANSVVPPGPFLDELKANGLVTCKNVMTYDTSVTLVFGPYERVCI